MSPLSAETTASFPREVPFLTLADPEVSRFGTGTQLNRSTLTDTGLYLVYNGGIAPSGRHSDYNTDGPAIIVSQGGASAGFVNYVEGRFWAGAHCYVVAPSPAFEHRFLYYVLKSKQAAIQAAAQGAGIPGLSRGALGGIAVPLVPIAVQREIVAILDLFAQLEAELEAELKARRRQYAHYRDELFDFGTGSPQGVLGDMAKNLDNRRKPVTRDARVSGDVPYYGASGVVDYVSDFIFDGEYLLVSEDGANLLARTTPIAFSIAGKSWVNNHAHVLEFETYAERRFVEVYLNSIDLSPYVSGGAQPKLNKANLNRIPVPNPPIDEKQRVVALLDKFDALINDLSGGIPAELASRRQQYAYYRDKLLTFEEATK